MSTTSKVPRLKLMEIADTSRNEVTFQQFRWLKFNQIHLDIMFVLNRQNHHCRESLQIR